MQCSGQIQSNKDYPQIIINSIPAPELFTEPTEQTLSFYRAGLKELDLHKPDMIVMVCNTIHIYRNRLQAGIKAPIIDIREAVRRELQKKNIKEIFVLATPLSLKHGFYKFPGIITLSPSLKEQKYLKKSIHEYNKGINKEFHEANIKALCKSYQEKGAQAVLAGCTEFAVMLQKADFPIIDTIKVLVNATVQKLQEAQHGMDC